MLKKFGLLSGLFLVCALDGSAQSGCVPPPAGLVSWWRGEGNAFDSASTNSGIMFGAITFVNAEVGKGFAFTGSGDDYVYLPPNLFPYPTQGPGTAPFSFELWFKTTAGGVILGQQDSAPFAPPALGSVPAMFVATNGTLQAAFFWSGGVQLGSTASVADGRFHHAAITYDGAREVLYLDGVAVTNTAFVQQAYSTNYHYQLGTGWTDGWVGAPGGWFPFAGTLDEISFYNRALTPTEVAALFTAGSAGKCTGPAGPLLVHRYSFSEPGGATRVTDAVGGANGTLLFSSPTSYTGGTPDGSGFTGSGRLSLAGTNGYVSLPPGLISSLSNLTLEAWVTWNGPTNSVWQRILDFGFNDQGTNASGTGTNYFILCPARGGSELLGFEETTVNPFGSVQDTNALVLTSPNYLLVGQETFIAVTYDPIAGSAKFYVNGSLVNSSTHPLNPLSRFADYNDWLGRSQWSRDPYFSGQYDEIRIWEGVLSAQDIAAHYSAGPDEVFVASPTLKIAHAGANLVLSWPISAGSGFQLQSTSNLRLPSWTVVTNSVGVSNLFYQVSLPMSGAAGFYRLAQ